MDAPRRRKYVVVGGDDVPSLGVLEGDILRLLWEAGEGQSSVQVYDLMYFVRRAANQEMQSPSTIAVTLSRMVDKGLLTVERRPHSAKGYYCPTKKRADVVLAVMDDVSLRLMGKPLAQVLNVLCSDAPLENTEMAGFQDVLTSLRKLMLESKESPQRVS